MSKTKTVTATIIDYTTGGHYQTFTNLSNAKTVDNNYAQCHVGGKNDTLNRPSTLTFNKFSAALPTGSMVNKVTVKYKHSKAPYNGHDCNVQAPTISLMNGNSVLKYGNGGAMTRKGQAPTTTATKDTVTFSTSVFKTNVINSNNFGVRFAYPTNVNNHEGYVRLYYLEITIEYTPSSYGLNIAHISGTYNGDRYIMTLKVSNKNLTKYSPTVTLTSPTGFSLYRHQLNGAGTNEGYSLTVVNANTFTIVPNFSKGTGSREIILVFDTNITYSTGQTSTTGTFTAVESLNGASKSNTVTIVKDRPVDPSVDPDTTPVINPTYDEDSPEEYLTIFLSEWVYTGHNIVGYNLQGTMLNLDGTYMSGAYVYVDYDSAVNETKVRVVHTTGAYPYGKGKIQIKWQVYVGGTYHWKSMEIPVEIKPKQSELTSLPFLTLLQLTTEELDRIGDGCVYKLQSFLKEVTTDQGVRDWYYNFRMAVFNNPIEDVTDYSNLTVEQIFNNAEFWSPCLANPNTFENIELEFRYNDDYPLYIIIVGDYPQATTMATLKFTEPCIIESDYYENWQTNGNYPVPIDDLVVNGASTELSINALTEADTLVFYNLPLEEDYGTNTDIAIRGFEVNGTMEQYTDNLVLYAALKSANGESRQRSIVLDTENLTTDNVFKIGQLGDLWGFSTLDMVELEDWEIHLTPSNALNGFDSHINFGDVQVILYIEKVEQQNIKCYIENEDLSYYGAFIKNVTIPPGLKTDTNYINVDGTDINDPYRQNIREKTIEIELDIGDCDLESSTLSLRELTRLLTNKRDQYNRPIPKRIEFSHYPNVYWEYIMEESPDTDIEISTYTMKIKLVIPAGTSYTKQSTITNTTGYVSGLAAIRPLIQIQPNDNLVNIKETVSGQEFNIGYDGDWTDKIVEIDCDDRIVWLKTDETDTDPVNISKYVDINSDWFVLSEEYQFECMGCAIRTVDYQERW